ncbi:MAG: CDP-alcohol phosphatidyltransferase family protein [Hyphomicrobiales bacterium]
MDHDIDAQADAGSQSAFLTGYCDTPIWGMTGADRAERMAQRLGCEDIVIAGEPAESDGMVLYLRTDGIVDQGLLEGLRRTHNAILVAEHDNGFAAIAGYAGSRKWQEVTRFLSADTVVLRDITFAGLKIVRTEDVAGRYDAALRKRAQPLAAILTDDNAGALEWQSFMAAYKGVTDVVTKYMWPHIAFPITRILARLKVSPNHVTTVGLILSILAFVLFWNGQFIWGLLCAWLMALLDTVDGKLARVTLTSSKWGNVFDHGIDLVAPPLWWLAWWHGLPDDGNPWIFWSVWVVLGGHIAGKLLEQAFISTFKFKIHMWQWFDSTFRLITARRNPNVIILTLAALAGHPPAGYILMAFWIVLCFIIHAARYVQAYLLSRNGVVISSWLEAAPASAADG